MVALFENIMIPLDGSEHSNKALEVAIQIGQKFGSKLTLVHVYTVSAQPIIMPEPATLGAPGVPVLTPAEVNKIAEAARRIGNGVLTSGEDKAKTAGLEVKKILIEGHAVQEISRIAKESKFDLIVIGARGISHIREMFLGSVTDGVMHHAVCPVLVIK